MQTVIEASSAPLHTFAKVREQNRPYAGQSYNYEIIVMQTDRDIAKTEATALARRPAAGTLWGRILGRMIADCFPVWADTPPYDRAYSSRKSQRKAGRGFGKTPLTCSVTA